MAGLDARCVAVRDRLAARGVAAPWEHQATAASLAHGGDSVVVATGTGSGKSLAYQLPGIAALLEDDRARVLYLAPTKALAGDQLRSLMTLDLPGLRAATFDGDTPFEERDWVRAHANWVLTNPDMLHRGILPAHAPWASFLRRLRYVVVDECHAYRGLFGAHVALILRRLRRVASRYGSEPTFVLASATVTDPAAVAQRLVGTDVVAVTADASPRGATTFALWEPPLTTLRGEHDVPVRRAAGTESARLLADLVIEGAQTLTFVRSRRGAELTALGAQRQLSEAGAGALAHRVAAYRGGYLPEERRALEAALSSGSLLGVASTNALELGLDVTGMDAVVIAGFPGTLAALWQQAGRAGRSGSPSLVVFVARDEPARHLSRPPPRSGFRTARRSLGLRPSEPVRAGSAAVLRRRRAAAATRRHRPVRRGRAPGPGPAGGPKPSAAATVRLVLDRARTTRRRHPRRRWAADHGGRGGGRIDDRHGGRKRRAQHGA
jgi:DEAD/DEAH box helicase domain-containing protein